MVEKVITLRTQRRRFRALSSGPQPPARRRAMLARACRHCGAALSEGESEDECSSAFNIGALRQFYAD